MSFRASDDEFAESHGYSLPLDQTNCYINLNLPIKHSPCISYHSEGMSNVSTCVICPYAHLAASKSLQSPPFSILQRSSVRTCCLFICLTLCA